jgi:hypothetical protein
MPSFIKTVLADTGFWYALFDPRDQYHARAAEREGLLRQSTILVPWPSLYETFNTRFAKNAIAVRGFQALLRQANFLLLEDEPYRRVALDDAFRLALDRQRPIALVDVVVRLMLDDVQLRKHGLLTFNPGDFGDVCRKHHIEIL